MTLEDLGKTRRLCSTLVSWPHQGTVLAAEGTTGEKPMPCCKCFWHPGQGGCRQTALWGWSWDCCDSERASCRGWKCSREYFNSLTSYVPLLQTTSRHWAICSCRLYHFYCLQHWCTEGWSYQVLNILNFHHTTFARGNESSVSYWLQH